MQTEIWRINGFYLSVTSSLEKKLQLIKGNDQTPGADILWLYESIHDLRTYVLLNWLGVIKIVKKHDKHSKVRQSITARSRDLQNILHD